MLLFQYWWLYNCITFDLFGIYTPWSSRWSDQESCCSMKLRCCWSQEIKQRSPLSTQGIPRIKDWASHAPIVKSEPLCKWLLLEESLSSLRFLTMIHPDDFGDIPNPQMLVSRIPFFLQKKTRFSVFWECTVIHKKSHKAGTSAIIPLH